MKTQTKQTLLILLVSLAVSYAIYGNGIQAQFTYDDGPGIQTRADLKDPRNMFKLFISPYYFQQPEIGLYRPLPMVTYLLNYSLFGTSPVSFHMVNILLHAICAFLVFKLITYLTSSQKLATITFLLFLVHPIHTEAISLIVGRAELLAFLFSLAFIYLHLTQKYFWAAACFLLSLLSKEIAVMTLPLLFFIQRAKDPLPSLAAAAKKYLVYTIPMGVYFFFRFLALGTYIFHSQALNFVENPLPFVTFQERIWTALKVLYLYSEKLLYPIELTNDYSYNVIKIVHNPLTSLPGILGAVLFLLLVMFTIHPNVRKTTVGLGAAIFLFPYILVSNLVLPIGTIMGERLIYFSSLGFVLIEAWTFILVMKRYRRYSTYLWCILAVALVLFSIKTIARNEEWLNNDNLYTGNLKNHPEGFLTQLYWGTALVGKNQIEDAKKHLARAMEIYPDNPKLITTLGAIAEHEGNQTQAERYYLDAISKYDLAIEAYSRLGYLYFTQARYDEAEANFLKALSLYPIPSDGSYYARIQLELKNPEKGIDVIHKYFGSYSEDIEIVSALGYSYYALEDYKNALTYLTKAKALGNVNPEIDNMIAIANSMIGIRQ